MIYLSKVLTFLILFVGNFGHNFELNGLIEQIFHQSDSPSVFFVRIDQEFVTKFMKNHFDIPLVIVTSSTGDFRNPSNTNSTAILVVKTSNLDLQYEELLQKVIQTLRVRKFVIISAENLQDLRQFFVYFWEKKFTRIFGVIANTSYAYLYYENDPIQEISRNQPLPDARKNMNGYAIRTTVQKDIPRVFWYPDKNGKQTIGGCFGRLFFNFLAHYNATFREIYPINMTTQFCMPLAINATKQNDMDITINVWGPTKGLQSSYPVRYQSYTIMVPLNGNLDPNQYFVRPFSSVVWLLIGLTLIYIVLMDIIKNILCSSPVNFWKSFSRTILILLNSPYTTPTTDYRFHALILVLAFVLTNVYTIYFTSFLTVFIQIKQYHTKVDLVEAKVPMMIPEFEWPIVKGPLLTAIGFDKIVYTVDYPTYSSTTNSMRNTQFCYAIGEDRAKFLIGLQTFFAKPLFHTIKDELFTSHLGYLMPFHSPFTEILDDFAHRIMELGFMAKWEDDAVSQALKAGFKIDVDRQAGVPKGHSPLTVHHLRFAWNCLIIGLVTSFVIFLLEKYEKNIKKFLWKLKNGSLQHGYF